VREFTTPGEFLLAIIMCNMAERQTRGGKHSAECVQRMHHGTYCHPGGTSEFTVRKEGKEEHEEFLSRRSAGSTCIDMCISMYVGHTVNACHTIWRFIKS
jgi:hypothetical protein